MPKLSAPVPITIGGNEFMLRPMRFREQAAYERYVQERCFALSPGAASDPTARRHILGLSYWSPESAAFQRTYQGGAYHLWLGLRKEQPQLTFENFRDSLDECDDAWEQLLAARAIEARLNFPDAAAALDEAKKARAAAAQTPAATTPPSSSSSPATPPPSSGPSTT